MKRTMDFSDEAERDLGDCMAELLMNGGQVATTSIVAAVEEALRRMASTSMARQAREIRKGKAR